MSRLKKIFLLLTVVVVFCTAHSQSTRFSLATDANLLRNFSKGQQFWAAGQTIFGHFHFTPKDGAHVSFSYYSEGDVNDDVTAVAQSPATTPQQIPYRNTSTIRLKHISLGWKKYIKGSCYIEEGWGLYGIAGFGLMLGTVTNVHSKVIDANNYDIPIPSGKANFKRLTFDLGIGFEKPLGGDIYMYAESRALIPTTDYPSKYLITNDNAPFTGTVNLGFRLLF